MEEPLKSEEKITPFHLEYKDWTFYEKYWAEPYLFYNGLQSIIWKINKIDENNYRLILKPERKLSEEEETDILFDLAEWNIHNKTKNYSEENLSGEELFDLMKMKDLKESKNSPAYEEYLKNQLLSIQKKEELICKEIDSWIRHFQKIGLIYGNVNFYREFKEKIVYDDPEIASKLVCEYLSWNMSFFNRKRAEVLIRISIAFAWARWISEAKTTYCTEEDIDTLEDDSHDNALLLLNWENKFCNWFSKFRNRNDTELINGYAIISWDTIEAILWLAYEHGIIEIFNKNPDLIWDLAAYIGITNPDYIIYSFEYFLMTIWHLNQKWFWGRIIKFFENELPQKKRRFIEWLEYLLSTEWLWGNDLNEWITLCPATAYNKEDNNIIDTIYFWDINISFQKENTVNDENTSALLDSDETFESWIVPDMRIGKTIFSNTDKLKIVQKMKFNDPRYDNDPTIKKPERELDEKETKELDDLIRRCLKLLYAMIIHWNKDDSMSEINYHVSTFEELSMHFKDARMNLYKYLKAYKKVNSMKTMDIIYDDLEEFLDKCKSDCIIEEIKWTKDKHMIKSVNYKIIFKPKKSF